MQDKASVTLSFKDATKLLEGQSPKDLFGTAAAAAEGGRDTRVLGDPMDLIRCRKLPGKAQWHTVQTSTN